MSWPVMMALDADSCVVAEDEPLDEPGVPCADCVIEPLDVVIDTVPVALNCPVMMTLALELIVMFDAVPSKKLMAIGRSARIVSLA